MKNLLKKIGKFISNTYFLTFVQLVAMAALVYAIVITEMFPMKYIYIIAGVLVLILVLGFIHMFFAVRKEHKKRAIFFKLISFLLSIAIAVSASMVYQGSDFINQITGGNDEVTYSVSIYVLQDSNYETLEDVKDVPIGIDYEQESPRLLEAVNAANEELGTTIDNNLVEETSFEDMADALYDGDVEAVMCCEELAVLMEAKHKDFDTICTRIWTYSVTQPSTYETDYVESVTENPFTVYVTGIDTYGEVNTVSRSDVNLVVTVNPTTKQILMVSIPRDTQITLHSKHAMDKLTHTGIYGTEETITTIEDFLNTDINYYARTNFTGLINIVNTLGGVTVDSPNDFDCTIKVNHQIFHVNKGINKLNGKQALSFVRERKHLPNGDYDRGRDQQILLQAMLEKCMTPSIIVKYQKLLSDVEDCFETDMTSEEIRSLALMQLNDMSSWTFNSVQIASASSSLSSETYSMYGTPIYVSIPDEECKAKICDLIQRVKDGDILTDEDVEGLK